MTARRTTKRQGLGAIDPGIDGSPVSSFLFFLYCYFLVDYFLHLPERIPGYGVVRPTLVLAAVIGFMLFAQVDRYRERLRDPRVRMMSGLVAYVLLTIPFVEWPGSVLRENLSVYVKAILFFFFTAFIVDTDARLKKTLVLFVGLQLVRVLEPVYLNLTSGYLGSATHVGGGEFVGRLSGAPSDVINPNGLGFVVVTLVPFLHYLLGGARSRWLRLAYPVLMMPLLYALVETASRGAFLTLVLAVFLILWQSRRKGLLLTIVLAGAVLAWSQMSDFSRERYSSLLDPDSQQNESVEGRLRGMRIEFSLALDRPVIGHGVGTMAEAKVHAGYRAQAAHNLYAELLVEIGAIGFVLFMVFLDRIRRLVHENDERIRGDAGEDPETDFRQRLNRTLWTVFWIYAFYSINYFGLSQAYWYFFGGLCVAFAGSLQRAGGTVHAPAERARAVPRPRRLPART